MSLVPVPEYLQETYWWAYVHPNAVRIFERQWLVNLILWGNFARLRDAALDELGDASDGKILQVACVYGDFTEHVLNRLGPQGHLDVIDVDHMVSVGRVREMLGRNIAIGGNLDPVADILRGTPDAIRAKLERCYAEAGNPFMVNAGCEIPSRTPAENLHALCVPLAFVR